MQFIVDGICYQYVALPMGLTCSPRVFTAVARFIATEVRRLGILAVFYLDDILALGKTREECQAAANRLLKLLETRGFVINFKKSDLVPSKEFTYLGHVWNTRSMVVALKPKREDKLRATAKAIMGESSITGKKASQFIGQVMSSLLAIPLARGRIRSFQRKFLKTCKTYKEFWKKFAISEDIKQELKFWRDLPVGMSLPIKKPRHRMELATDGNDFKNCYSKIKS